MFCSQCGSKISENTNFCHNCGVKLSEKSNENGTELGDIHIKESLLRKTRTIVERWDIFPEFPALRKDGIIDFKSDHITEFDPLYRLVQLKQVIINTCMEDTQFRYKPSFFDDIVQEVYTKNENFFAKQILQAIMEHFNERIDCYSGTYSDLLKLRVDEYEIFTHCYCIISIASKLQQWEYLLAARQGLRILFAFQCNSNTNNPYFQIKGNGRMLSLQQFQKDYHFYNKCMGIIGVQIEKNGSPELKQQLANNITSEYNSLKKCNRQTFGLILVKVFACIAQLFLCGIAGMASEALGFPQDILPLAIIISMIVIMALAIPTYVKAKNIISIVLFSILFTLLYYPLCWLLSYALVIALVVIVLFIVGLYRFIRS